MNTTFTNCAEKKAKQFLNLLQGYTKGIRITAILILLLMGVSNAWAVNHTGGYVYFLKPSTWTESTVMMLIGRDQWENDYTTVYTMTKIANTDNLYRYTMPKYDNANYVTFANASSAWGSGNWHSGNRTNAPHYTNVYNDYGFNSSSYYVVVPASTSNNADITINYKGSASNLNLTTRANVYGSTDGGSTYSSMAEAGTVSVSGYYMSNYSTASTRAAVSSTASLAHASTTLAPGSTATFKATAKTGYEFVGWFTAASGGTAVSTDATYTFKYDISYTGKTLYARFKEQETHPTVTFAANGHGTAPEPQTVERGNTIKEPTMADADGRIFAGWYTTSTCTTKFDFTTPITSSSTLYAKWVAYEDCVFFKNNLGWGEVYVHTFTDNAWYNDGSGVHLKTNSLEKGKKMTQRGQSDIYYYILEKKADNHTQHENSGANYIAFTDKYNSEHDALFQCNAIYRGDFKNQLTLFIPDIYQTPETHNWTQYYSSGLWMKYNSDHAGYQLAGTIPADDGKQWDTYQNNFTTDNVGGYTFSITKNLSANTKYEFNIKNYIWLWLDWKNENSNQWFVNLGTLTESDCMNKWFKPEKQNNAYKSTYIQTTIAGDYTFNIYLGDGRVMLSVDYPLSVGDYQLWYTDDTYGNGQYHKEERIIKKCSTGSRKDTISFFVRKDKHPKVLLYRCSNIQGNSKTWTPEATLSNITVDSTSVYNFVIEQTNEDTHQASFTGDYFLHTGDFYIRTDAADGGWKNYSQDSHRFTYSSYADEHEDFSHYFCKWVTVNNVKFNVATDYSETLCSSMAADPTDADPRIVTNIDGNLPNNNGVNVRFGWDCHTNQLTRAYLAGADTDYFLRIIDAENLKKQDGTNVTNIQFKDLQNWIYQLDVKAIASTKIKLVADYANERQFFKGSKTQKVGLLGSTATTEYDIRLIYNFKTNHLVAAMILDGDYEVTTGGTLVADMMVIRKDQGDAEQLTFNPNTRTLTVDTAYAVMTFTKTWITNTAKKERERSLYWVSFPFNVQLSDVFGFGEYGEHWIMQYYDGVERAQKGLFIDSGTYWKYITDTKTILEKGKGYVLVLDLNKVQFPNNVADVSLYFPSKGEVGTIGSTPDPNPTRVDEHWCTIVRPDTDRRIYDSHWNMIGVPGFANVENFGVTQYHFNQEDASFYYAFDLATSKYSVASALTTFKSMYAYMVQFAGNINWTTKVVEAVSPQQLAARRNSDNTEPEKVSLRLEIAQDEVMADQTFVQLQQEGATAEFDMNLDLTKIINSGANIYTLTDDRIQTAGNAVPMGEALVPVGVKIDAEGEYTFRMPDGTEGMVVELIDYERDITTNLLLFDYTVTLPAGSNESRFALHIQPNKSGVTTGVEEAYPQPLPKGKGAKFLIDGKLIIRTAEGVIYDAQGHVVQ